MSHLSAPNDAILPAGELSGPLDLDAPAVQPTRCNCLGGEFWGVCPVCGRRSGTPDRCQHAAGDEIVSGAEVPTFKLKNGRDVFAKDVGGELSPVGYANRTQALACVARLGAGWDICRGFGRPFYVGKVLTPTALESGASVTASFE